MRKLHRDCFLVSSFISMKTKHAYSLFHFTIIPPHHLQSIPKSLKSYTTCLLQLLLVPQGSRLLTSKSLVSLPKPVLVSSRTPGILGREIIHALGKDPKQWRTVHALSRSQKATYPSDLKHVRRFSELSLPVRDCFLSCETRWGDK